MANAFLKITAVLATLLATAQAIGKHRPMTLHPDTKAAIEKRQAASAGLMDTRSVEVDVDHFDGSYHDQFSLQYMIDITQFDEANPGPILFYAGNEGPVEAFYEASGFVTDTLAKELKGVVLFGEHRFYGKSMPFGATDSFKKENLKFLDVRQVMEDYITLVDYIKSTVPGAANSPVIVFGGSYGGMLAAWMRMKYPNKFVGAIAASAPLRWFDGVIYTSNYTNQVANDILHQDMGGQVCFDGLKDGFYDMLSMQFDASHYAKIASTFHVCDGGLTTSDDMGGLISFLQDSIAGQAQVNYPYPVGTNPAFPLKASCKALTDYKAPKADDPPKPVAGSVFNYTHVEALAAAANISYNATGALDCLDLTMPDMPNAWEIQTCSQLPMPQGDDPSESCFTWNNFDKNAWTKYCQDKYGLTPQYSWALDYFGGRDPSKDWAHVTNIVYTNGDLDPWRGGGLNKNYTTDMIAVGMKLAAHHLDLRLPNAADPKEVILGRNIHRKNIKSWISGHAERFNLIQ